MILLSFIANFLSIIVFAVALDSRKRDLASWVVEHDDETDPDEVANGIHVINTISLAFASAVNAYACFAERSASHLTLIGLAYLTNLIVYFILTRTSSYRNLAK